MNQTLFVGFEHKSGDEVKVPIFHTLVTGQTQLSGKTTCLKTFAKQLSELDYKVLIFDTKENKEDYENFGEEIPVSLRESTDALVLLPLLESVFRRRLPTGYYSVLCDITGGTKTFEEVIKKAKEKEKTARSGWVQGACRTLYDLLERLQDQLSKVETVPHLELPYEINRMVLNQFPQASQQLFVRNAFEDILHIHNIRTIPMLDEAYKFIPQKWSSACAKPIQDAITQTAGTDTYVYLSTQFLAPTNKDPLKACAVRLLGTQDHSTEARHTLDLIPFKGICTVDDIMTLPLGHYIVTTKKFAKLTYFLPLGVPTSIGKEVALGKKTSEFVRDHYLKPSRLLEEDEEMYRQKFEEEKRKREQLEDTLEKLQYEFAETKARVIKPEEIEELRKTIVQLKEEKQHREELERQIEQLQTKSAKAIKAVQDAYSKDLIELKNKNAKLAKDLDNAKAVIDKVEDEIELLEDIKMVFSKLVPSLPQEVIQVPASKTIVDLEHKEFIYNISHKQEPVSVNTQTVIGKVLFCSVKNLSQKEFTEIDLSKALLEYGWNIKHSTLAPTLGGLVKEGKLVRIKIKGKPIRYRLPSKLQINIEEK